MHSRNYQPINSDGPEIGDLAINEDGAVGVITLKDYSLSLVKIKCPIETRLGKLNSIKIFYQFVGAHLYNDHAPKGSRWTSYNPRVIGCVDDAEAFAKSLKNE